MSDLRDMPAPKRAVAAERRLAPILSMLGGEVKVVDSDSRRSLISNARLPSGRHARIVARLEGDHLDLVVGEVALVLEVDSRMGLVTFRHVVEDDEPDESMAPVTSALHVRHDDAAERERMRARIARPSSTKRWRDSARCSPASRSSRR